MMRDVPANLCPILDRDGREINIGDSFTYQPGTAFELVGKVYSLNGEEIVVWDQGAQAIALADFWYGAVDSPLTVKVDK